MFTYRCMLYMLNTCILYIHVCMCAYIYVKCMCIYLCIYLYVCMCLYGYIIAWGGHHT